VRTFGSGPPIVALHGFTHTGEQFAAISRLLGMSVIAPDLPGHGATRTSPITVETAIAVVAGLLDETGPVPVLGYSQGARIALLVALAHPGLIASLTLISASPGVADRAARQAADEVVASRIERDGLSAFLDAWLATGLTGTGHLSETTRNADRAIREANTASGLAAALRGYGQGAQPYVEDRLDELTIPVTFMAGSRDSKYAVMAASMATAVRRGKATIVEGAGHNLLHDAPDAVVAACAAGQSA
jgi:2-succinyl-6-hydroxy-2,4-cyclohexadiene-1-carboxylate synthase